MRKYAFVMIKPDSVDATLDIAVLGDLEKLDLKIVLRKLVTLSDPVVENIYPDKIGKEYLIDLKNFFSTGQSLCMVVAASDGSDVEQKIRNFKEFVRHKYAAYLYLLPREEYKLYEEGAHPRQDEIKKSLSFRNVIHVTSEPHIVQSSIRGVFTSHEIDEIKKNYPDLYELYHENELRSEKNLELRRQR